MNQAESIAHASGRAHLAAMRMKQIAQVALISLVVVIGVQHYQSKSA